MSFRFGPTLDKEKAFLVRLSEMAGRLDPSFHRPYFKRRRAELDRSSFPVTTLGGLKGRIFQGVGRNLIEGAPTCLLKVKNITPDGKIDFTETEPVAAVPKSKLLQPGDIISPFIGAAIKGYKFAKFTGAKQPCAVDNNTGVIRITDSRITADYLHAFCQTGLVRWQLDQLTGGGGVPFLGSEYARRIRLPLPPEGVQKTAVEMLREAERIKEAGEDEARALLQTIDDVLVNELGIPRKPEPPNTLENRIFRRNFSEITGERFDPHFHRPKFEELTTELLRVPHATMRELVFFSSEQWDQKSLFQDTFPYIEIGSVDLALGKLAEPSLVPIVEAANRAKMLVRPGDILISLTRPTRKAICFAPADLELAVASNGFCVVRGSRNTDLDSRYLFHVLRSLLCTNQFDQRSSGGSYPAITEEQLSKLIIPLAKPEKQIRIAKLLDAQYSKAEQLFDDTHADLEKAKFDIEALILGKEGTA